ncbi:Ig-like domain-containing protein [Idiomarina sp. PL1-037]|uniref:Ig-like domain-containing protein n=1 Tax=Idiomarina sp. PL1-037 TaxID=3095365 RepID=UPI002ACBE127|nr:Ig-like domain-containing protein [Idiomarina sp. PL1-037]WQC53576.1 Ig-like domain-containing protein [Idiomarina sp. PL1-037]
MIATIVRIEGNVQVQRADGSIENLAVGDQLFEGDVVLTESNSNVVLEYPNDEQVLIQGGASFAITREQLPDDDSVDDLEFIADESSADDILNVLDETDGDLLEQFQAPAAGNAAAGGDTGSNFVRLARVLETVYDTPIGLTPVEIAGGDITAAAAEQPDPGAVSSGTINLTAEYDQGGSGLTLSGTTTNLPPASTVSLLLTDSQGNQFTLTTTTNADGSYSVSGVDLTSLNDGNITIQASAVDATGETITDSDAVVVDETAGNLTVTSDVTDGNITVSGTSTDMAEGTEVAITITDANGTSVETTATIAADGTYTVDADISGLVDGDLTINAVANDNNGTEQTASTNDELDNVAGDLTVASDVTDGSITVSGTSTDMAEGTEVAITITDKNGTSVETTATIAADGTYTVDADISGLVDGPLTINAVADDNNDTEQTASTNDELDNVDGDLTVASDVTDGSITVSGTSTDMAEGTEVAITIIDENGETVTATATIAADGTYTVDADISGLVDGPLTINAVADDNNDTEQTASTNDELDNVDGDLTVASDVTDGSITVSGTSTDMAEGTEVAITIIDENGETVTATATIAADGTYTVDADISGLVDGPLTINAVADDNNDTEQTASTNDELDNVDGDLTVASDVTDGSITVSGTSTDMAEGTEVAITIIDENGETVTATATIAADGTYTVDADISGLVDGPLTINAVADDNNDTEQTASTNDELDNVDGDLTVASDVTDGSITVSGTSTDMAEGTEVAITIIDENGETVTATATIAADGTYTVDADISGLVDGDLTINAVADDNNGTEQTASTNDELDNVAGDLTVTSAVTDGSITVSGTSTDMAEGTEVAITITDENGETVTATATIAADGTYTVDADISGLVDGPLTINAVAEDNNGTEQTASTNDELDNVAGDLTVASEVTDGSITVSGSSVDMAEGTEVSITIIDENGDTVTTTAIVDGDGNYSTNADISGLVDGDLTINAVANDNNGTEQTASTNDELDNVAGDLTVASDVTDGNITVSGGSVDMAEGTEVSITIIDENGDTVTTTAIVDGDGNYSTNADISGLVDGQLTINAKANDNNDTEQTASTNDELDNVDGSLSADASVTDGTVTVSGGSTDLPEGAEVAITITDANGDTVETTATVDANGDYTVDADVSGLVDGELTIDASATDNNGETVTATDTAELDNVAGDLTVTSDVTDGSITVSGTSTDMAEGTEVSITITDANGDTVTATATVGADGNYTVDADISGLVDGQLTINAVANDNNGTEQTASTNDELDNVAGDLTVASDVTDGNITVSGGSVDMAEGTEVTITITDENGDTVTATAVVDANGNYSTDTDISGLVDGDLTINAVANDNNGTEQTASTNDELDNVDGSLSVESTVTDGSITVSGSSVDMSEGTEVTITIEDENGDTVTTTAIVDGDGNYSTNADISGLVDGDLTINAVAEDNNGTEQTASTNDELDNVAGDLTVASEVTDGSITVSGTSTDMAAGTEVAITIEDENGDTVTATATIAADGTYTVDADISGLVDGPLTINAVANDNNGTEQTASTNDELDNVAGDLTVASDVTDGNITVSGSSVDMAEGTEVSITIIDANGDTVTATATIAADGTYTVDADISGLVDGELTINAVADDNNDTEQTASTTDELDNVAGDLTVASEVTDGSITVSGTSTDMAEGTEVAITITDVNGTSVETTATIAADGTYTVDADMSGLVDGDLTINAVANDNNGTEQTASTTDELDNVAGDLTVTSDVTDGTITVSGTSTDMAEGTEVAITITDKNGTSVETTATIAADGTYTVDADISGLVDGDLTINAVANDNNGTEQTASTTDELDNVAGDLTVTSDVTDGNITVSGGSVDMAEGTEVTISITDENGDTVTATAVVDANGNYSTNADISGLVDGDLTINAVADDNNGTEQTASTTDELDNVAGDLTVASDVTDGSITISGSSVDMAEGTEVSITIIDANGDTVTATATIAADGTYTVDADISGLVDGDLTINAVANDNNGTEQTASTNDELDNVAGDLTVASDVTDGSITVSGTSTDMAEGTEVSITIIDANGDTVTATATIAADGTYTVDTDISGLVDGDLTINAVANDNNGTEQTASTNDELDNVAGDLTVASDVTDGSITVSGSSVDMAEGTEVTITITDENGDTVTTTAIVDGDGNYSTNADISGLVDGDLTINAVADDNNDTEQTASTNDELDNVAGDLTVNSSVNDGNITVSGSSVDMAEGTEVAITITDANGDTVTATATIAADGTYTVDADISGLVDGDLIINAIAEDNNGTEQTASTNDELDNVAGDLTVASDVTDGNITVSGGSVDMAEGTEVSITIIDENGDTVTTTAIVDGDGNYSTNADISGLVDGDLTINAVASDNNGTEQTASTNDELDNVAGDLTVASDVTDGNITVSGGSVDMAEGTEVTITITDENGDTVTTTAIVDGDGNYSTNADISGLVDGPLTINAVANDNNGTEQTASTNDELDNVAGDLTVTSDVTDGNITVSGTSTDMAEGTEVTITITDENGDTVTATAVVDANGNYSTDTDISHLVDGDLTINAVANDNNGTEQTASTNDELDNVDGSLSADATVTDGTVTVSGGSTDLPEGTEVAITITDANGDTVETTATVDANGDYTVDADVSGLVDGELTIDASATDNNGETVTATDTAELDNVAGDLTVASDVTDGSITVSGSSVDMAEGTEVSITIIDENGDTVTTTAIVDGDGNYSTNADISGLVDGDLTINAVASDNNGTEQTASTNDELDNVAGDLTVASDVTDGSITVSGSSVDMAEGTEVTITIEDENGDTVTTTAIVDGDGNYSTNADISGLVDGPLTINAVANDNNGTEQTASTNDELDNVAGDLTVTSAVTDGSITVSGTSTDMAEGTEVAITITDENGDTVTTTAIVDGDGNYSTNADISGLVDGDLTINAVAEDNNGTEQTASTNDELDNVDGSLSADASVTNGTVTVSGGSTDLPEGTEVAITITDANGDTVETTATVDANGDYTVDADVSGLVDGELTIDASATDNNGDPVSATDTAELDNVAGDLTVASDVTDGNITVSGTSTDMAEGTEVTIAIIDANGDTVTATAVVDANGNYSTNADISGLVDGDLTINAVAEDNNGTEQTASTNDELDNVDGSLSADATVTDGTVTVSGGSTDLPEGTEVAITITDANGDTVETTATVDANGDYTVDADVSGLVDGELTIDASATDNNGETVTATDTAELDNVAGDLTVASDVTDGSITVSGSSVDMAEGTEVSITIIDENGDTVTTTAIVDGDGNYSTNADISGLVDGDLTINAVANDNNGTEQTASTNDELDNVAGDLTVASDVTDGNITVSGGSVDMAEGTEVSITIIDENGDTVTTTAIVDGDGNYSTNADISGLVDGDLTINAVADDNNGTEQTASTNDELDNVAGDLTVASDVTDGNITVSGSSVDMAEGTEVSITIIDENGDTVTTTAIVDGDGNYSTNADISGLVDGDLTINAVADDNNGTEQTASTNDELDNVAGDLTVASDVTDGNITVSGSSVDMAEGTEVSITIIDENGDTVTTTAIVDGDGNYSTNADISGLVDGDLTINAVANDNNGTEQTASTNDELDNVNGSLSADATVTDGTVTVSGGSTDLPEGAEVAITITDANGDIVETTATVDANGDYTVDADVSGLVDGELTIDASATDNNGDPVSATDTAELDNVAGDLTVASDVTDGNITVSGTSTDMAEGTEVTITIIDANGDTVTATATVGADGNYTVDADISGLVDGQLTINAVADDNNGTEQTASTTDELDNVAGDLTVNSSVTDGNITVSGSSVDMAEGTEVSITIIDANGDTVTATATVGADGNYTVDADISGLVDGQLTINAVADDNNGTEQTASTNDELDNVAGDLTVNSSVNDGNITVSGSSVDMAEGTEVSITITDANGDTVTATAVVDADGNYSTDTDISGLVDGDLTIDAVANDNNGTEQTASTNDELDNVAGDLTVTSDVTDGSITVSGSSTDMAEGTEVTITITDDNGDTVTATAVVDADGNYSTDTDISGLVDGDLTINAVANDNNGTEQTASTNDELDNVAGDLTVTSDVTDGSITVSGSSVDMAEGTEVSITITDANGDTVTATATVGADGNYTVDADISGLVDGQLTINAVANDNNGTEQTASTNDELDNVDGSLSADATVTDGTVTVSGGSTDLPEGTEVAITITDANGDTVETTATVDANGDYTVDADVSGLVDGELTIDASATDNNGDPVSATDTAELDNVAGDLTVASEVTDGSITVSGSSVDMAEGTEVAITITDENGDTVTTTAIVDGDGNYSTNADISGLVDGDLTINAVANDNNGTEQTASTNDELDNVDGSLSADATVTDGTVTVSGGSTDLPEGTEVAITITDENGDTVETTATVDANGDYTVDVDVSGLVDGELTIDASATDNNGETVTATDTAELDNVAGDLTVASDVTDGSITVSGSSTDMAEGTEVAITIIDENGDTVTATATVGADGNYTVDADISGLVDGDLIINAIAEDNNGTEQTASTNDELDNVDGSLSADATVTDGTVTVSGGSTDLPEGTEVAITITDANGDTVETTATVDANGDYTVDADVSGLVDGELTIDASATDNNGDPVSATDTTELDNVAGDLTVTSDVTDGNITVSGTSTDMTEGTEVAITITDANGDTVTATATVDANGDYTVDTDISGLVDGDLTIDAVANDNNGTEQTASTNDELDNVAGDLTVTSDVTDGNITVLGTSTDMAEGTEVAITITDANGDTVTATATVGADGNYTVDADISGLVDGDLTIDAVANDNNGTEQTASTNDELDNVDGSLSADATVTDGTVTVSGGSTDLPEGTEVAITITDANGDTVETTATVDANGDYTVDADVSGLVDGELTIDASATDNNGDPVSATDTAELDNVAGDLTVASEVTDGSITVSGSSVDMAEGTEVAITITDENGDTVTTTAIVDGDGNYSTNADISGLVDGDLTINAVANDNNGTEQTASTNDELDNVDGSLSADATVTDGTVTVSGGSTDLPEGTEVAITITDENGDTVETTATVDANGDYTVDVDVSGLVDGELTIDASATDNNGETVTATDTAELDNVAGDLTVASDVTDGSITVSGSSTDMAEGTEVAITIIDENGDTVTATATIAADGTYTVDADISGLVDGDLTINAVANDNNGTEQTASTNDELDNVEGDLTVSSTVTDGSITVSGSSVDMAEGTEVAITITDENGDTVTTTAIVDGDGNYSTNADISGLVDGDLTINAVAEDNNGTEQTASTNDELDNVAGDLTVASSVTDGSITVSGSSVDMAEGTEVAITITDENGDTVTTTAIVDGDGNYSTNADISGLVDGDLTINAVANDNNDTEQTASTNDELDNVDGSLSADSTVTDGTVTVSGGSTDLPEGAEVAITITDANGDTVETTATVDANGDYTVDADVSGLVDGELTIDASATDNNGETVTATDTAELDNVEGDLTVNSSVTDGNITVSGSSVDMAEGTEVSITITDANGDTVTATATVGADGNYTVDADISGLVDGDLTINAVANDNNDTEQTASTNDELDNVDGSLSADATVTDGTVTVSGGSTDLPEGTEVAITITDANGGTVETTATVDANGDYTVDADVSGLVDGELTIDASATDNNGETVTATDTAELDTTAPTLTINAPDTNDTTPILSGTSDEIGATISVTVTDANNQTQTLTAIVAADGSWTVDVADELAEGTYTVQASVEDDAGNEAVANTQGEIDLTAPTLTLEVPTNVNDTTPTISGTSDEIGGTVYLVVTDADGNEQQLEATVDNNGNWQVDAEIPLAVGEYTVSATISDDVGNQAQASQSEGTIEPSVTIVDFELNSEVGVNVTDSIWSGGVSNNQFGIVSNYSVNENDSNQRVNSRDIDDDDTRNLNITSQEGSNETYLFAVGDTYIVSYDKYVGREWSWDEFKWVEVWETIELEMTVTRSDVQGFNGQDADLLVLTGTLPDGTPVTMVMDSDGIQNSTNYYVNDLYDTDVGFREFTVNGEAAVNSTVTIEQVDENGNVIDSATVTSDANGQWSYDVGQLEGRSGILKVTSIDQYGNESVDEKNFLFGETNNENTLEGSGSSDLIVGGLEDDSITGGQDSDVLIGGGGNDTFVWNNDDEGTVNIPEADTIQDFTLGNFSSDEDADRLDLSDLLQGESTGTIDNYLYAEDDGNGNTVLHINSEGNLGTDNADQVVTLQDVQMADGQSSSDFIQQMLNDGQLLIDNGSSASTQSSSEGASIDLHQTNKLSGLE